MKFFEFPHEISSHLPEVSALTQSCFSLVVDRATGWLSFHDVNWPSVQVMSVVPKSPPVLLKIVPSEKV